MSSTFQPYMGEQQPQPNPGLFPANQNIPNTSPTTSSYNNMSNSNATNNSGASSAATSHNVHMNNLLNVGAPHVPTSTTPRIHNLLNSNISSTNTSLPLSPNTYSTTPSPTQSSPAPMGQSHSLEHVPASHKAGDFNPDGTKQKKKSRRKSTTEEKVLLSTSSPEGIAAASEITPNRIANILLKEGPLPIRHLTGHLIQQVPAFGNLSLSKQRRLIMASLESGDLVTGCIFEKIGWGQWEAKVVGKAAVKIKIENSLNTSNVGGDSREHLQDPKVPENGNPKNIMPNYSLSASLNKSNAYSRSSPPPSEAKASVAKPRRESITSHLNEGGIRMPRSPTLGPIQSIRGSLAHHGDIDEAIESSSSGNDDDDDDFDDLDDDHDNYNRFNRNTSPESPPAFDPTNASSLRTQKNKMPNLRSPSMSSSSRRPSFAGIAKPRKPRHSFTQHTLEVTLDEAPLERRESRVSFSNSANLSRQSFLRTNILPRLSNNASKVSLNDRDNENAITDEYDDNENAIVDDNDNDNINEGTNYTDEEDWKAIGASSLKKNRRPSTTNSSTSNILESVPPNNSQNQSFSHNFTNQHRTAEELAAIALMDLKTI